MRLALIYICSKCGKQTQGEELPIKCECGSTSWLIRESLSLAAVKQNFAERGQSVAKLATSEVKNKNEKPRQLALI